MFQFFGFLLVFSVFRPELPLGQMSSPYDFIISSFRHIHPQESFVKLANKPYPSSLVPLLQSESKCKTILMTMTLICMKMKLHSELIFIWKVSHLDSFWNRGWRELGNGPLTIQTKKIAAGRGERFISSKLGQNPSEMDIRAFARIKNVIRDQLLATKAEIIQN